MNIKKIFFACLAGLALTSCSSDEDAFFTVSKNDAPRILNTDFPEGGFSISRNENLRFEILVTPTDMTTVKWLADGKEVFVGNNIDQPFEAGNYTLKVVATTTMGKETSRTMNLTVKPIDGDPQATSDDLAERLLVTGTAVKLHGTNMTGITKVVIDENVIDASYNADEGCVEYTVPTDLTDGSYRISLMNEDEERFGGGRVAVIANPTVSKSSFAGVSNSSLTLEGFFLDKVASITINGKDCPIVEKTENRLTITAPELALGNYELKGTTESGETLKFFMDCELLESALFMVSEEKLLWDGNFTVDWDGPEDHKEWRGVSQEEFDKMEVGHTLFITLQLVGSDYHKCQFDNWSWEALPGLQPLEFSEDMVVSIEITQALKDAVAQKAFCIHGHGFSVTKVTYK